MDAKTFLAEKYSAALDELRQIDAEYAVKMAAAQARIDLAKTWLDELASQPGIVGPVMSHVEVPDPISESLAELKETAQALNEVALDNPTIAVAPPQQVEAQRRSPQNWISARDLRPNIRQAS